MSDSRVQKSIRNSTFALLEQATFSVTSFVCRTFFIHSLGEEYLGLSGLFQDVLSLLSLIELGVGSAILSFMYLPVVEGDEKGVAALLKVYKKFYCFAGIAITVIGLCLTPFLDVLISDIPNIPNIGFFYILFLLPVSLSYFWSYKRSILIVYQKSYIASCIYMGVIVLQRLCQILSLIIFKDYILYLIIALVGTILNHVLVSLYVDKEYGFLKRYSKECLSTETAERIAREVRGSFFNKVSGTISSSTDNIFISRYISTILLGKYSNYLLFTSLFGTIFQRVFEGLNGSVGNLVVSESKTEVYRSFKRIWFINFWIVSFTVSCLFGLVDSFITLWIGKEYTLGIIIVTLICVNFFFRYIRNTFILFTEAYGLYSKFKMKSIVEAVINIVGSLTFVKYCNLGISGVLLGTLLSSMLTNFWYEPHVMYLQKFGVSVREYYKMIGKYFVVTLLNSLLCYCLGRAAVDIRGWGGFGIHLLLCVVFTNVSIVLVFFKTDEFRYAKVTFLKKIKDMLNSVKYKAKA
ncbi:MAG: hypothetical protein IJI83_00580 [Oscillospiraceae bacterium]|nr:hypothetical protein [Oscillospiraceae bacterium]